MSTENYLDKVKTPLETAVGYLRNFEINDAGLDKMHSEIGKMGMNLFQHHHPNGFFEHGYDAGVGYYHPEFRPTIAIPKPGNLGGAINLANGYLNEAGLGLHPNMTAMHDLYTTGNLVVMPAVHYPGASRSHFSGQHFTESANVNLESDGWLHRYLADSTQGSIGTMRAAGIGTDVGNDLPQALRGDSEIVSVFSDLRNFELGVANAADEQSILAGLTAAYNQSADPERLYAQILHDFGKVTVNDLGVIRDLNDNHSDLDPDTYDTSDPANPYTTSGFGLQLKHTALLIKAGVGLEVACINRGGFDTHSNQGALDGAQGDRIQDVSDNVAAFFHDLNFDGFMDDVLVMTVSEFGRTSFENGSFGTDHAHATCWFLVGTTNTIIPGVYLGHDNSGGLGIQPLAGSTPDPSVPISDWINYDPLHVDNMINGRYLNHTIEYQNVYGEVLTRFLNANYNGGTQNLPALLPEFTYSAASRVGFLV